jgi:hypothetical protein
MNVAGAGGRRAGPILAIEVPADEFGQGLAQQRGEAGPSQVLGRRVIRRRRAEQGRPIEHPRSLTVRPGA